MRVVHIIPTYNERENIGLMIDAIETIGKKFPRWTTLILVVDDHSPDGTSDVVEEYKKRKKNVHILLKKKEGLGAALILGYEYAMKTLGADVVVPNDADFQWDPVDFPRLVVRIEQGYDVAVASRHIPGGHVIGWDWFRFLNHNISNSLLAWWLAGVHEVKDHAGNFKAIRVKGVLDQVPLHRMKNVGFSFQLHILYELSKTGASFIEIPVTFRPRKFGISKIGFNKYYIRDVGEYIKNSILIRIDRSKHFVRYCIVGGIGFVLQSLLSKLLIVSSMNPGIAVSIGAEGAVLSNFILNNSWTFRQRKIARAHLISKFLQFHGVSLGAVLLQGVIVSIGTYFLGRSTWFLFMVLAIVIIVIPYSYFMYSRFIWKKNSRHA